MGRLDEFHKNRSFECCIEFDRDFIGCIWIRKISHQEFRKNVYHFPDRHDDTADFSCDPSLQDDGEHGAGQHPYIHYTACCWLYFSNVFL